MVVGLAWTSAGGDILFIETSISKGKGNLTLTGNLGNVMKASTAARHSLIWKAHAAGINLVQRLMNALMKQTFTYTYLRVQCPKMAQVQV